MIYITIILLVIVIVLSAIRYREYRRILVLHQSITEKLDDNPNIEILKKSSAQWTEDEKRTIQLIISDVIRMHHILKDRPTIRRIRRHRKRISKIYTRIAYYLKTLK